TRIPASTAPGSSKLKGHHASCHTAFSFRLAMDSGRCPDIQAPASGHVFLGATYKPVHHSRVGDPHTGPDGPHRRHAGVDLHHLVRLPQYFAGSPDAARHVV